MSEVVTSRYELRNCEELSLAHPDTFYIPDRDKRENITIGEYVKVCFIVDAKFCEENSLPLFPGTDVYPTVERMWVQIEDKSDAGHYVGSLRNHPKYVGLKWGDAIIVKPEHIINLYSENQSE